MMLIDMFSLSQYVIYAFRCLLARPSAWTRVCLLLIPRFQMTLFWPINMPGRVLSHYMLMKWKMRIRICSFEMKDSIFISRYEKRERGINQVCLGFSNFFPTLMIACSPCLNIVEKVNNKDNISSTLFNFVIGVCELNW